MNGTEFGWAVHEVCHGFLAENCGFCITRVAIAPKRVCQFRPDVPAIVESESPLSEEEKLILERDLLVSVAGPIGSALYAAPDQEIQTVKFSAWNGRTDRVRFNMVLARLKGVKPDADPLIEWMDEAQRRAGATVTPQLREAWQGILKVSQALTRARSLDGPTFRAHLERSNLQG